MLNGNGQVTSFPGEAPWKRQVPGRSRDSCNLTENFEMEFAREQTLADQSECFVRRRKKERI